MPNVDPPWERLLVQSTLSAFTCRIKKSQTERKQPRIEYMIEGRTVCRDTFRFLHSLRQDRLSPLVKWYTENGFGPEEKKSGGRNNQRSSYKLEDI